MNAARIRLTPLGKAIAAALVLAIAFVAYQVLFAKPPAQFDISKPAVLEENYPFDAQTEAAFRREALPVEDYCAFFSFYDQNLGVPIQFTALLDSDPKSSPYYFYDSKLDWEYVPAYYVKPDGNGYGAAKAIAEGDEGAVPGCASSTLGVILIGFPRLQRPQSPLVKVTGTIYWNSEFLNPAQFDSAAGAETQSAPVVAAGAWEEQSPSQLASPATRTIPVNIATQRGPGIVRVKQVEFAADQTRVLVELINKDTTPLPAWSGLTEATLAKDGKGAQLPLEIEEDELVADDMLTGQEVPPKGSGTLEGYLLFPPARTDRKLFLKLPDLGAGDVVVSSAGQPPVQITIPPAETPQR